MTLAEKNTILTLDELAAVKNADPALTGSTELTRGSFIIE